MGVSIAKLRAQPRWYAFGFLMLSIWPLVLLYRFPVIALLIALPAFVLFFVATTGTRAAPTEPVVTETPDAAP
jgi:hypothetical protein